MFQLKVSFLFLATLVILSASAASVIYPPDNDPISTIENATSQAKVDGKALLIVFGADWCGDCRALDKLMDKEPVTKTIAENFEVVHVDVGNWDKNEPVRTIFGYPAENGIPPLVVMDSNSTVHFVSRNGEFAGASSMGKDELNNRLQIIVKQLKSLPRR